MVRNVQVDETVQQYADRRMFKRAEAEVGVVVGRSAAGKDFLLQLVCCPDQDGETPVSIKPGGGTLPSKKGSGKGKAAPGGGLELDREWIIEHARQVSRLLPGGLDVLGLYVLCPEAAFAGGAGVISIALKQVAVEVAGRQGNVLALHVDSVTAKLSAKEVSAGVLRPCELKTACLLPNMAALRCRYVLGVQVSAAGGRQKLHEAVRDAARWEYEHKVAPALGLVEGQLRPAELRVADIQSDGSALSVELLVPLGASTVAAVGASAAKDALQSGTGSYQRMGEVSLSGVLDCRAFVHRREPAGAAVEAVKADIERSLQARLEVLVDAAEMATAVKKDIMVKEHSAEAPPIHPLLLRAEEAAAYAPLLPRRAVAPWRGGGGCYCDYLVEGEGKAETMQRLQELVGHEAVEGAAFECEEAAAAAAAVPAKARTQRRGVASALQSCNAMALGAAGVAVIAVAVGVAAWATGG